MRMFSIWPRPGGGVNAEALYGLPRCVLREWRLAVAERPVLAFGLHEVDDDILAANAGGRDSSAAVQA